jgi:hypothetical protein
VTGAILIPVFNAPLYATAGFFFVRGPASEQRIGRSHAERPCRILWREPVFGAARFDLGEHHTSLLS